MEEKQIFHGKVFDVVVTEVEINGRKARRDLVIHHGGVSLSCIQDGKILLVRQSRAGAGTKTLEIPAGTLEPGEDPKTCGLRELNEEAGLECDSMELITAFWPTPGYDTEVIWVYECTGLHPVQNKLPMDDTEDIETLWMDLNQANAMIESGEIRDGKTIIAIYHALLSAKA